MGAVQVISHLQEHVDYRDSRQGAEAEQEGGGRTVIPLSTLEERAVNIIETFAPRDLATTMNKYGKIGIPPGASGGGQQDKPQLDLQRLRWHP